MRTAAEAEPRQPNEERHEENSTDAPLTPNQPQSPNLKNDPHDPPHPTGDERNSDQPSENTNKAKTHTRAPTTELNSKTTTPTQHTAAPPTSPTSAHTPTTTPPTPTSNAPKWVQDFMDAAASGMRELRKEVQKIIENGKGKELENLLMDMQKKAPKNVHREMGEMVKAVTAWLEHPEELEEGGRWWAVWCPTVLMEVWTMVYAPVVQAWDWLCPVQMAPAGFSGTATGTTLGKTTTYTRIW